MMVGSAVAVGLLVPLHARHEVRGHVLRDRELGQNQLPAREHLLQEPLHVLRREDRDRESIHSTWIYIDRYRCIDPLVYRITRPGQGNLYTSPGYTDTDVGV